MNYRPMEMKNYSQHLLRMKTTSSLTTGAAGGRVNTGHHVIDVSKHEVEQGVAPSEQFIALRNPTGSREFIELCARRGAGPPRGDAPEAPEASRQRGRGCAAQPAPD